MLVTLPQLAAFLAAAVLITLSPGPDNLMVLSQGISRGRRHGMAFGLGCALGCLNHTLLAALGISALIAASPAAFAALKIAGGGYLVYLGWGAIRSPGVGFDAGGDGAGPQGSLAATFRRGLIANAINPKVVLFFLAFLPQFVNPAQGPAGLQTAILGTLFSAQGALIFGALGYFSGHVGQWLARSRKTGQWLDRTAGAIFIALGLRLILAR
ncbi:LysE family translocator [Chromobacterium subtsugae]|uniref:LysE family translocator n=1 Tax=Chromobacterium subtsugae TaxID=251747 RepID=A0ABS7FEX0_9NEIS|nr:MULTISPECIES: LysE family translocator [Chromobacterium]KUM03495.1 lysine transporter LysE [Chromobacterium subtsugae]KZE87585.1 lysine transporter LysE [Chromobacterium sp. F49]MBW7567043.1 LysE family translocator [Chromobacterium subtsugae]MBW8288638.1 LysE family translocator [Chromobacterium subtsugae]WSE90135.1 LysE family translocator [Chromobacterium subtsugae]